jgi:hypothetical protein
MHPCRTLSEGLALSYNADVKVPPEFPRTPQLHTRPEPGRGPPGAARHRPAAAARTRGASRPVARPGDTAGSLRRRRRAVRLARLPPVCAVECCLDAISYKVEDPTAGRGRGGAQHSALVRGAPPQHDEDDQQYHQPDNTGGYRSQHRWRCGARPLVDLLSAGPNALRGLLSLLLGLR